MQREDDDVDAVVRLALRSREELDEVERAPVPLALRASFAGARFHRDVYFDTADRALQRRGVTCRIRLGTDGRRALIVTLREGRGEVSFGHRARYTVKLTDADPRAALRGASEPARMLQAIVDPARLSPIIEMETERRVRVARRGWIRGSAFEIHYDDVTARAGDAAVRFQEIHIHGRRGGRPTLDELAGAMGRQWGLTPILADRVARAQRLIEQREATILAHGIREGSEVAVIPFDFGRLGFTREGGLLKVPTGEGTGEQAARAVLESQFGTGQAQVRLLGTAPAAGMRPRLEVWLARRIPDAHNGGVAGAEWVWLDEAIARVGTPALRDPRTLATLHVVARSNLMIERDVWRGETAAQVPSWIRDPRLEEACLDPDCGDPRHFINENLSLLAFHARVLALAEDRSLPLLERLRFLAIFWANMDEFFTVAVGKRKRAIAAGRLQPAEDAITPVEELDAIAVQARRLFAQAYRRLREDLAPALAARGIRILRWADLSAEQRRQARRIFHDEIYPVLTPLAASPNHPFPHIPSLRLSLAALTRDAGTGVEHFVAVPTPEGLPRFIRLPGTQDFIPIEAVICANLGAVLSGAEVLHAHSFRVTRSGDIHYHEDRVRDLLQEIEEEVERRPYGPVVRIEIEPAMPQEMRDLLIQEFRFESRDEPSTLAASDLYKVHWLVDMAGLSQIADLDIPELHFARFRGTPPLPAAGSVLAAVRERDWLLHHPYDAFEDTVERFLLEASEDPEVRAIKITLYRTAADSRVVEGLIRAAERGKEVVVLVELKARYDEERNIRWARRLESRGIHVIYGLPGLKTHAKTALVIRRERDGLRRYALVGTGNLNATTSAQYTDLAIVTADPAVTEDMHAFFNAMSGYTSFTAYRHLLVAPHGMLERFLELIRRETEHAKAGRGGLIRAKLNGLAEPEIIRALYHASQAGVRVDLVVRGICRLRPGVRGLSDNVRVISLLGRFLEHARIFHFGNAGEDEYYIGSADWRARNLRRRVEVVAPVFGAAGRARLDRILTTELEDPTGWALQPDGSYGRRSGVPFGAGQTAQERLMVAAAGSA